MICDTTYTRQRHIVSALNIVHTRTQTRTLTHAHITPLFNLGKNGMKQESGRRRIATKKK